jgi:hypothetical protein
MKISVENRARSGDTVERMPARVPQGKRGCLGHRRHEVKAGLRFLTRQLSFLVGMPLILVSRGTSTQVAEKGS